MSKFMPTRPAADFDSAGRPMRRESQRMRGAALGRYWDTHPQSDVSLPIPASIHSSMSSDSEFGAFRISALDSLAPRPTLRYGSGSRLPSGISAPTRSASQRKTLSERGPIPEATLRAHKRIDDLADDLDARGLRELMEREDRRKQKQQERSQKRIEEKLARRAQRQMAEDDAARQSGTQPSENLERGVMGRELVGLGIEPASAVVTSSKIRDSGSSGPMEGIQQDPADEGPKRKPSDVFHTEDDVPAESEIAEGIPEPLVPETQADAPDTPAPKAVEGPEAEERVSSLPPGSVFAGLLRRNKSRSKSTLNSDRDKTTTPQSGRYEDDEKTRKNSEASYNKPARFSLASLIRRGGRKRRESTDHPSFSNTSREEMQAVAYAHSQTQQLNQPMGESSQEQLPPQNLAQAQALARLEGKDLPASGSTPTGRYIAKSSGTMPKRTRSRFKEDLPDFPISPPASRVNSPEAEPPLPPVSEQYQETSSQAIPIPATRSIEAMRMTPTSPDPHQSISLASIDSEGSWLSGRVNARRTSAVRDSLSQSVRQDHVHSSASPSNSTQEDLAIMDDEYLSRLAPERRSSVANPLTQHKSGEGRPSSDEDDLLDETNLKWGSSPGARPRMVDRETMRSRQGMLDTVAGGEDQSDSADSPTSRFEEKADLGRARSVDLASRGHVRNFSAGSAKLLDIHPRNSVDDKSRRQERRSSVPLH